MKKLAIVLLLGLGLIGCPKNPTPPPGPPTPPSCTAGLECGSANACPQPDCNAPAPTDVCGDGRCTSNESTATCAADCPGPPPPPPPPPPVVKHDTYSSLLICCGPTGQPNFDPMRAFAAIAAGGHYNTVTLHVLSPWNNTCFYPFDQPAWWDHLKLIFEAAAKYGIRLHLVLMDRYGPEIEKWMSSAIPCKTFPLKMSAKDLFENWNRRDVHDKRNFAWLYWTADAEDHVLSGGPSNANGEKIINGYLKPLAVLLGDTMRAHPETFYVAWSASNEPLAHVRCLNSSCSQVEIDHEKSLEQDPRTTDYIRQLFAAQGLKLASKTPKPTDHWLEINTDMVYLESGFEPCYKCLVKNQQNYLIKHGMLLEIHGCNANYIKLLIASGLNPAYTVFSQDGVKDTTVLDEALKTKSLKLPWWEFKLPDQAAPNGRWDPRDIDHNLSTALPFAEKVWN